MKSIRKSAVLLTCLLIAPLYAEDKIVKIGLAAPLTGSQAAIGVDLKNAAQMAVDEANDSHAIPGVKLVLDAMDDKADPKEAVSVAHLFAADDQVVAVVGHLNSGCSIPASSVYHQEGLLMITPCSTNPKLTEQGYTNVFRVSTTDLEQGVAAGRFVVKNLQKKRFAILHDKSEYGQGLAEEFKKQVLAGRGTVLDFEGITQGDQDFSAVLSKIKPKHPDVLYFGGMYPEGALLAKQMRQAGIGATFMGGDGLYSPEFINLAKKDADGTMVSFLAPPYERIKTAKAFVKKFKKLYKQIKAYAPYAYDATNIVVQALKRSGALTAADRGKVIQAVKETGDYSGVVGTTSFDEKGDTKNKQIFFYVVRKGQFNWYPEKQEK